MPWSFFTGSDTQSNIPFLEGQFIITIHRADDLPNMDGRSLWDLGGNLTDGYVRIKVDGKKGPKSRTVQDDLSPVWEEDFVIPVAGKIKIVQLDVKDDDPMGRPEHIGTVEITASEISRGIEKQWFDIPLKKGDMSKHPRIMVSARYVPVTELVATSEIIDNPFQAISGCKVTMYSNAHVDEWNGLTPVPTSLGPFSQTSCWDDVFLTLEQAKVFIYITGWSVYPDLKLVRDRAVSAQGTPTLGEMLKLKADQGVRVNMMVWDEMMSVDSPFLNAMIATTQNGMMGTHDEVTRRYFKGTKVNCALVQRLGSGIRSAAGTLGMLSSTLSWLSPQMLFTHHQKTIICDAPVEGNPNKRRLVAFVGGLDLTTGRFDTAHHHLFASLNTLHKDDFYQALPNFDDKYGPREPWHDIHGKFEGGIAHDVKKNFEERWCCQNKGQKNKLLDLENDDRVLSRSEDALSIKKPWTCQLFRSIDKYSSIACDGVEQGIYEAYLHNIRRAQHFIFIENQYFLGSSTDWIGFDDKKFNVECKHRVPVTLAAKCVEKIQQKQPFHIYIVIPEYPEGLPEDGAVQAILRWQFNTVEFMYKMISDALNEHGPPLGWKEAKPTDYLSFYFLAIKEPQLGVPMDLNNVKGRQRQLCQSRRFMIYVHSKMMIVDDEFIIMGSANINQRSMGGDRDTEICVGSRQDGFTVDECGGNLPDGDVAGFRKSLFNEHLGIWEECFTKPNTQACIRRVAQMAEENWQAFVGDNTDELPGAMTAYPYTVDGATGAVTARVQCFPDHETYNAQVCGQPSANIPAVLTT